MGRRRETKNPWIFFPKIPKGPDDAGLLRGGRSQFQWGDEKAGTDTVEFKGDKLQSVTAEHAGKLGEMLGIESASIDLKVWRLDKIPGGAWAGWNRTSGKQPKCSKCR